jgi:hypothetical protein
MAESKILVAQDHLVALDHGHFYLEYGGAGIDDETIDYYALLEQSFDSGGIAHSPGCVVVLSPHQNNFEMPLRVEVWDGPPPDDIAEWPEAFETHLDVNEEGLTYHSPVWDAVDLPVPPGGYHALITGRGFVAHGWPGSTTPGDSWRIRLWPSTGPDATRRLSAWGQASG